MNRPRKAPRFRASERGAALIAVLAMVMLLAGFASLGLTRLRATADRVSENDSRFQAGLLASSGALMGARMIGQLKARARSQPELLQRPVFITTSNARLQLQFRDAGNCFNLNSLIAAALQSEDSRRAQADAADLARLLQAAGVDSSDARTVAEATARYLQNRRMPWVEAAEWTALPGVTRRIWAQARPLLCALPSLEASRINLNSLTPADAPLLVAAGLDIDEARRIIARRPKTGWGSGGEFWQQASSSGMPTTAAAQVADTRSRWISLSITATVNDTAVQRQILLDTLNEPARISSSIWQTPDQTGERSPAKPQENP